MPSVCQAVGLQEQMPTQSAAHITDMCYVWMSNGLGFCAALTGGPLDKRS